MIDAACFFKSILQLKEFYEKSKFLKLIFVYEAATVGILDTVGTSLMMFPQ